MHDCGSHERTDARGGFVGREAHGRARRGGARRGDVRGDGGTLDRESARGDVSRVTYSTRDRLEGHESKPGGPSGCRRGAGPAPAGTPSDGALARWRRFGRDARRVRFPVAERRDARQVDTIEVAFASDGDRERHGVGNVGARGGDGCSQIERPTAPVNVGGWSAVGSASASIGVRRRAERDRLFTNAPVRLFHEALEERLSKGLPPRAAKGSSWDEIRHGGHRTRGAASR